MTEVCAKHGRECPVQMEETLQGQVNLALSCRSFLWDVLLGGDWTGCSAQIIRNLRDRFGTDAVREAFNRADTNG